MWAWMKEHIEKHDSRKDRKMHLYTRFNLFQITGAHPVLVYFVTNFDHVMPGLKCSLGRKTREWLKYLVVVLNRRRNSVGWQIFFCSINWLQVHLCPLTSENLKIHTSFSWTNGWLKSKKYFKFSDNVELADATSWDFLSQGGVMLLALMWLDIFFLSINSFPGQLLFLWLWIWH